ncbi:MAG: hypothetical protein MH132_06735 [Hydrotalea sp.]|nr:hypothetical protein [Hydrotalea sp.]
MNSKIDLNKLLLSELEECEIIEIHGGGIGKTIGKAIGWLAGQVVNTVETIGELGKMAMEYQHSLPPNLKK